MLRILNRFFFSFTGVKSFVAPAPLLISKTQQPIPLQINKSKQLLSHRWAQTPIIAQQKMMVPVFSLLQSTYIGQNIEMKEEIFNQPVRKDLIYRLYHWRINLNKIRTHHSRTQSETSGSGSKPRPQKGQGRARLGNLRAPGRKKGVKAHGAKPKIYTYHLNEKIKLKALKSLLSSKLSEGKIRIVDTEDLVQGKTKLLQKSLQKHSLQNAYISFITSTNVDINFEKAQRNIKGIKWFTAENFDVLDIIKSDKIIITKSGLQQLTLNLFKAQYTIYRQPHMKPITVPSKKQQVQPYDPSKPIEFKFRILSDYLQMFEQAKSQKQTLLQRQMQRVKKIVNPS